MKESEITALAREYAEEKTDAISFKAYADPDFKKELHTRGYANEAKEVIEWLLRRYCLVEKEVVCKEYDSVKDTPEECNYEELGATWDEWPYLSRFYDEGYKLGQKDVLESLFPEIGKEVEG